jgi:F0F1-type ATP synthase assembly protein I
LDEPSNQAKSTPPEAQKTKKDHTRGALVLAMELPFTIVGAVVLGCILGYFLDHWLHTKVIFTLILGGVGFVGGLKEVLRRLD